MKGVSHYKWGGYVYSYYWLADDNSDWKSYGPNLGRIRNNKSIWRKSGSTPVNR
ncbi:MAG: hypothetical protein H6Q63_1213 [Firmicutes bacterium]|nr:hypothetical protein [Bacillota bacterium]